MRERGRRERERDKWVRLYHCSWLGSEQIAFQSIEFAVIALKTRSTKGRSFVA